MTAFSPAPLARETTGGPAAPAWLSADLQARLERAAAAAGVSVAEACQQWLQEGLERFEAQETAAIAAGRCSLRTGSSTIGPLPLPVQQ
jgi:hypothetical protein